MIGQTYRQRDNGKRWIRVPAGRKNRAAADKEIVNAMDFAMAIDNACFRRFAHSCGAHMMAAIAATRSELGRIVRPMEVSELDAPEVQAAEFAGQLLDEYFDAMPFKIREAPIDDGARHSKKIPILSKGSPAF
jgi:hypothetical protein